jgi:hypothetical protein
MPTIIRITSQRDGFRRCGIAHPATPTDHPADRFTPEELARLQAEPMLRVELIEEPDPAGAGEPPAKAGRKAEK